MVAEPRGRFEVPVNVTYWLVELAILVGDSLPGISRAVDVDSGIPLSIEPDGNTPFDELTTPEDGNALEGSA
jgi:hypothetical protein